MKRTLKKITFLLVIFTVIHLLAPAMEVKADTEEKEMVTETMPVTMKAVQKKQNQFTISFENVENPELLTKDNFQITEHYKTPYGEFVFDWSPARLNYDAETKSITFIGRSKFVTGVTYKICYVAEENVVAECEFIGSKLNADGTLKAPDIILYNQEAIHIPAGAVLADGSPVSNMIDVAEYAFSYVTENGDLVIPSYETDRYGIADIISVDYSAVKSCNTVIVQNVYFKIFFDPNNDGQVTTEEKTTDTTGFYTAKVVVNKTLTVEQWDLVQ